MDDHSIFISHTGSDVKLVEALKAAIDALLPGVRVEYSSSRKTGPQGGEEWRGWIDGTVLEANTVLLIVTPQAIGKPWLLWEAGAARGVGLASNDQREPTREIITFLFGVPVSSCPDPLRGQQVVVGTDRESVWAALLRIVQRHGAEAHDLSRAGKLEEATLAAYQLAVWDALTTNSSLVTEPNIQDWMNRLVELEQSTDVTSALPGFIRWLRLAFGSEDGTQPVLIDVRLHRKLGLLLLNHRDLPTAVAELELARRDAPRDIYVLRPLGEAYLKLYLEAASDSEDRKYQEDRIGVLLAMIEAIDETAFINQPDAAALYAKYLRKAKGDPGMAVETLARALAASPDSSYLADILGQAQLELSRIDDAQLSFRKALAIIDAKAAKGVWDYATAASAHLVLGQHDLARQAVASAINEAPNPSERAAISSGLQDIARHLALPATDVDELVAPLKTI